MRCAVVVVGLLAAMVWPVVGYGQVTDFCPLLEARIVADDGQFIGRITPDTIAGDSLVNPFGDYGNQFSLLSIFNSNGPYGNSFSTLSPFHSTTFQPPRIIRQAQTVARLTVNVSFSPRVDPNSLVGWLRSSGPFQCSGPTPTHSPTPTTAPPATPTTTPSQPPPSTPTTIITPSNTPTFTPTPTPTSTPTITNTPTITRTPTVTRTPTNSPTPGPCHGDCNYDGMIAVNELIIGINIALGNRPLSDCSVFDINRDGSVSVGELVTVVRAALQGCVPLATPVPTQPTATPSHSPTRTFTLAPSDPPTAVPTATATLPGGCPGVIPSSSEFRRLGNLAAEELELTELETLIEVTDVRQKHHLRATLFACHGEPPGSATFRIAAPDIEPFTTTVAIDARCGDITDATAAATFIMPHGFHPISIFVSGDGTYTGGAVEVSEPPFEVSETREIFSALSLLAGESEIPDLRVTLEIDDPCAVIEVAVALVVAGLAPGIGYEMIIATEGLPPRVSPMFAAGTASNPTTEEFVTTFNQLPVGQRTFAVFVRQSGTGPAIYERQSRLELSIR